MNKDSLQSCPTQTTLWNDRKLWEKFPNGLSDEGFPWNFTQQRLTINNQYSLKHVGSHIAVHGFRNVPFVSALEIQFMEAEELLNNFA